MSMGDRIKVTKWNDTRRTRWKSRSEIVIELIEEHYKKEEKKKGKKWDNYSSCKKGMFPAENRE